MSEIVILTKQQRLIVDPPTRTIAIMPVGPTGPAGLTGPSGGFGPNKVVNGGLDVWQRGAGPFTLHNTYAADQWKLFLASSTMSVTREMFTPGNTIAGYEPPYFMRAVVVGGAVSAASAARVSQPVESVRTLAGQTAIVSFWAKADSAKNVAVEFQQGFGTGGSPSASVDSIVPTEGKVALSTVWQHYVRTFTIPSIVGKTIGTVGDDVLRLSFWLSAGTDYNARTQNLGQQSGTFDIWGVQLESGPVATAFQVKPIWAVLAECQRYYYRMQSTQNGHPFGISMNYTVNGGNAMVVFPTTMRAVPSMTPGVVAGDFVVWNPTGVNIGLSVLPSFNINNAGPNGGLVGFTTTSSSLTAGMATFLLATNASAYLAFSAEL